MSGAPLSEQEFYDRLAAAFDVMTDWPARLAVELPFLEATLQASHARRVLDCACGTGWHAIALARRGYRPVGADISPAMVARAQENARREGVAVPFVVAAFTGLAAVIPEPVDAVLCLGNSLPHVLTEAAAEASLAAMRACLVPGGVLVLQGLNYDRRWREKPRWFPAGSGVLDGQETLIWRFADYHRASITFNIALFTRAAGGPVAVRVQSVEQRPYRRRQLARLLRRAGFRELACFGDLQGAPFDPDRSGDLVMVARAPAAAG